MDGRHFACRRAMASSTHTSAAARATGKRISGPAGALYIDDGGVGGLPIVFAHSFAGSSAHWSAQLQHLRPLRRAVAFDLRGHGRSDPPGNNDYSIESLASDVVAVIEALHLDRVALVGHSLGGATAVAFAGAHPERLAGLVLAGTPGRLPESQAQQIMSAMEADFEKVSDEYWSRLLIGARPEVRAQVRR